MARTTQVYPRLLKPTHGLLKTTQTCPKQPALPISCYAPILATGSACGKQRWVGSRECNRKMQGGIASPMSTPCVISTLQVMECSPFLGSDYPVLGDFCDLQYQMDRAGGRLGERCLQYSFTLLIYMRERAVLMHTTAHRLSSFQQQAGRQERETESYPLPYLSPSLRQRQWLLQSLLF